jgi:hypothetical protein
MPCFFAALTCLVLSFVISARSTAKRSGGNPQLPVAGGYSPTQPSKKHLAILQQQEDTGHPQESNASGGAGSNANFAGHGFGDNEEDSAEVKFPPLQDVKATSAHLQRLFGMDSPTTQEDEEMVTDVSQLLLLEQMNMPRE